MLFVRLLLLLITFSNLNLAYSKMSEVAQVELPFPAPSQDKLNCDYYLKREAVQKCGDDSYLKGFGYKYCRAFKDYKSLLMPTRRIYRGFSEEAKLWYTQVGICLQNKLHEKSIQRVSNNKEILSCEAMSEFAIESHPNCYIEPNKKKWPDLSICNLGKRDQVRVAWVIRKTFLNYKILGQMLDVLDDCGFWLDQNLDFE